MIIIKYNLLAAYSKKLYSLFASSSLNDFYEEKFDFNYKKHTLVKLQSIKKALDGEIKGFVYFTIEDIPSFWGKSLESIISKFKEVPIVLFPLVSAQERITSIVTRDGWNHEYSIYNSQCGLDIECYINSWWKIHILSSMGFENVNNITFDDVILMRDFEELVYLHNQNKIKLLVLTKNTIINNPKKIFDELNIPYNEMYNENMFGNARKIKVKDRYHIANTIYLQKKKEIENRYNEIRNLIVRNDIKGI